MCGVKRATLTETVKENPTSVCVCVCVCVTNVLNLELAYNPSEHEDSEVLCSCRMPSAVTSDSSSVSSWEHVFGSEGLRVCFARYKEQLID